jgi:hypothetical protein
MTLTGSAQAVDEAKPSGADAYVEAELVDADGKSVGGGCRCSWPEMSRSAAPVWNKVRTLSLHPERERPFDPLPPHRPPQPTDCVRLRLYTGDPGFFRRAAIGEAKLPLFELIGLPAEEDEGLDDEGGEAGAQERQQQQLLRKRLATVDEVVRSVAMRPPARSDGRASPGSRAAAAAAVSPGQPPVPLPVLPVLHFRCRRIATRVRKTVFLVRHGESRWNRAQEYSPAKQLSDKMRNLGSP